MTDEKLRILQMLENGTINASQAADLLSALQEEPVACQESKVFQPKTQAKWIRTRITNLKTGEQKVDVRLPLAAFPLDKMEKGLIVRASDDQNINIDKESFLTMLNSGELGNIVEIKDEESGDHIQVSLE